MTGFGGLYWTFLFILFSVVNGKRIPRWWVKVAERQGPNACVVEEVPGTNLEFWTECRYWLNRHICGRKTRIRFECCEGYDHLEDEDGCTLVKPLTNVLETAESLGATKWASFIRENGLTSELENSGPFTLFAPTNDAFDSMSLSLSRQMEAYRGLPTNPVLLYHMIPSKLRSDEFNGDQLIETSHEGHHIRINRYSNGMTTVNCALMVRKDQEATNGIVHVIEGVLDPSVEIRSNIVDMIVKDGRFQFMAEMLESSGYINVLRSLPHTVTVLVPSDEAFQKLPNARREKFMNDRALKLAILQNHIVPHVICESAVTGEHKVRTIADNRLTFDCSQEGAYVERSSLTGNFNLGKNGIMHVINDVLLPDRAKTLVELAESRSLETFVDFVKKSGLEETLEHTGDYTFFVPDENAWFEMPPEEMLKARRDPEYAGLLLRFHGAYGRHLTNQITDNQGIMSLDEENPVRLQVWRRALGVEDARITDPDIEGQNGVIHIINKVIFPSNRSVGDILKNIRGYSFYTFEDILTRMQTEDPSLLNLGPGGDVYYTFFIPTDQAFEAFGRGELYQILSSSEDTAKLLISHVAVNMFPKTSFEEGLMYSIDGLGSTFNVRKEKNGAFRVNNANILSSHMSANGVIHVIDKVFEPKDEKLYVFRKTSIITSSTQNSNSHTNSTSYHSHTFRRESFGSNDIGGSTVNEGYGRIPSPYPEEVRKFSYIGHPYGSDVVGHDEGPLPYTTSSSRSTGTYEQLRPDQMTPDGKINAYAFSNSERDFADGTEFAESSVPSEEIIQIEQAKLLRSEFRRNRHDRHSKNRRRRHKKHPRRWKKLLKKHNKKH